MRIRWLLTTLVAGGVLTTGCFPTSGAPSSMGVPSPQVSADSPTARPSPSPTLRVLELGDALPPVKTPSAARCDQMLRADLGAAREIRSGLTGYFGLATADARLTTAASDPDANMTMLGIPLLPDDVTALTGLAILDWTPLVSWAHTGRQDLFGGMWIDPPGSQSVVVSIVDGDLAAHELARCLEQPGLKVRYVAAERSQKDLHAIQAAIEVDRKTLSAEGIDLIGTVQLTNENVILVGVQGLTGEIAAELAKRYGEGIRVEEDRPSVPD